MKIQLKRIEYSEHLSEETYAFSADLYINGKKAGIASNSGRGGNTRIHPYDEAGRMLIGDAEEWCKALPAKIYPAEGTRPEMSIQMDLENYIDDLLEEHLKEKFLKGMQNRMKKAVIVGTEANKGKAYGGYLFKQEIAALLATDQGRQYLTDEIKKIGANLKVGEKILNTNIPPDIYMAAGLEAHQYETFVPASEKKDIQPKIRKR